MQPDPALATKLRIAEHWVRTKLAQENVPGASMAIVHDQRLVWARGFGLADLKSKTPATPQTRYGICSISKIFTSMAAMRERDAGRLDLDRPLSAYLGGYSLPPMEAGEGEITPRAIMTHSSGLPREADFRYWSDQKFPALDELKARLGQQKRLFQPFERHQYSNLGMSLLGEAVAGLSGRSYGEYIVANFLRPLGMARTTADIPIELRGKELAVPYRPRKFGWERRPHEPTGSTRSRPRPASPRPSRTWRSSPPGSSGCSAPAAPRSSRRRRFARCSGSTTCPPTRAST
jgi:CubicO group peptidase (beta-lactamase class C family)